MKKWQTFTWKLLFLCLLLAWFSLPALAAEGQTRIHFISLGGSSDAILLESNGHFGMVDSGEDTDYPDGSDSRYPFREGIVTGQGYEKTVNQYLKKLGVKKLDFYNGTHAHSDHIGSGDEILEAFKTSRLYLRKYSDENISNPYALWDNQYCYDNLIPRAKQKTTTIIQDFCKKSNRVFTLGDMQIEILNYKIRKTASGKIVPQSDDNNNSLGVKITAYGKTAFLGGDINNSSPERDEAKIASQLKHVDLLKLNHHGYSGSNSSNYLKKLSPTYAVVTGPASNLTSASLNTLNQLGTQLYSTYNQPSNSAVIATFEPDAETIVMTSPGNLSLKKKNSGVAFYTASNKRYKQKTGWFYYNQQYYYLTKNGYVKRNSWVKEGTTWYYLNQSGEMVTDATRVKGVAYAFYANGELSDGGWTQGRYYRSYAKRNGKAYTGLKKIGKKTYYFDSNGRMQTGLVTYKKKTYYFQKNGTMLKNSSVKVDGYRYTFDKNGVCTEKVSLAAKTPSTAVSPADLNAPEIE